MSSWSNTQIVAAVPAGASTGPVNVEVGGVSAYGPSFQVSAGMTLTDSLGNQSTYSSESLPEGSGTSQTPRAPAVPAVRFAVTSRISTMTLETI